MLKFGAKSKQAVNEMRALILLNNKTDFIIKVIDIHKLYINAMFHFGLFRLFLNAYNG